MALKTKRFQISAIMYRPYILLSTFPEYVPKRSLMASDFFFLNTARGKTANEAALSVSSRTAEQPNTSLTIDRTTRIPAREAVPFFFLAILQADGRILGQNFGPRESTLKQCCRSWTLKGLTTDLLHRCNCCLSRPQERNSIQVPSSPKLQCTKSRPRSMLKGWTESFIQKGEPDLVTPFCRVELVMVPGPEDGKHFVLKRPRWILGRKKPELHWIHFLLFETEPDQVDIGLKNEYLVTEVTICPLWGTFLVLFYPPFFCFHIHVSLLLNRNHYVWYLLQSCPSFVSPQSPGLSTMLNHHQLVCVLTLIK